MHERMLEDPSIGELVHLQGKIGESTRFPRRKKEYSYATSNTGILIDTLTAIILNSCFICRKAAGRFEICKRTRFPI
jgi:hypothetical protein